MPILLALSPIILLLSLIMINVLTLGSDTMGGANQLSLLLSAFVAGAIALSRGVKWNTISAGITHTFSNAVPAILILLMVGVLSGSWMSAGIIPTMIYYGLDVLHADYFLPATVVLTAAISVATGSSWSTVATIGVALIGIGDALGFNPAWTAGAIISGAYFGDKVSPLSDTTNLASTIAKVDLFKHIRYMMGTTVPSIIITLVVFVVLGIVGAADSEQNMSNVEAFRGVISGTYNISLWLLLIPAAVIFLIVKKMPAVPVLMIGSLLATIAAAGFQGEFLQTLTGSQDMGAGEYYKILTRAMYGEVAPTTGNGSIDELLTTGGMMGMIDTVWLIISAMIFAGVMESSGMLERITGAILSRVRSRGAIVSATTGSCVLFNMTTGDQYMAIVIPGKMFYGAYQKQGLDPRLLSRTLEDGATATSVLIPWNTCGATQATILGVATTAYLPFAIFCWLSPLMTIAMSTLRSKPRDNDS